MFKTKKGDWYFIIPATMVWLAALIVTAFDFAKQRKAAYHFRWSGVAGLVLMVTGVGIRVVARRALGKHFSYALRILDKHELITDGIYKYIRHPAYSGDLMFHFGTPLLVSSWKGFLVMLLLIPCMRYRIKIEEDMLTEKFGDEYRNYRQTSRKLIPYLY